MMLIRIFDNVCTSRKTANMSRETLSSLNKLSSIPFQIYESCRVAQLGYYELTHWGRNKVANIL